MLLIMKTKNNIRIMFQKNTFKKLVDLLFLEKKAKSTMILLRILIHSCKIILKIMEGNTFVVTACKLLAQKIY